ncbi:MAG: hypothetical protein ACRDV4_10445, partial [Acidimicrobiales bacterium]
MTSPAVPNAGAGSPSSESVAERLAIVRRRLEVGGRDPAEVTVVAVTKGFSSRAVAAARSAGLRDVGENYAEELLDKARHDATPGERDLALSTREMRWHYLGTIQRRKVKDLAAVVGLWQTVSRVEEGDEILRRRGVRSVMVEVETTGLQRRNGCRPSAVAGLVRSLSDRGLEVAGLMTVGPPGPPEGSRDAFRTTARLARDLGLCEVSMGMSDDLE